MANYGWKSYTPEQIKAQWRESVHRENAITKGHSATKKAQEMSKVDANTPPINYFSNQKMYAPISTYDCTFQVKEGYNSKLKRDDQQHTQGLNVHGEEVEKDVPILMSSEYGHRPSLECPDRSHVRIGSVRREFYRSCGTNLH